VVRRRKAFPLAGAVPEPLPGYIEPCLATLRDTPPEGAQWLHEIKYDGYRVQAHFREGKARLYTRRGYDWTDRFGTLSAEFAGLPLTSAIFDGEVIGVGEEGRPDYGVLQGDLARGRGARLIYYAFDLLYLDGFDLRKATLRESPPSTAGAAREGSQSPCALQRAP